MHRVCLYKQREGQTFSSVEAYREGMNAHELFCQHFLMFKNAVMKNLGKYLVKHIHTEIKQNPKTQKPA